MRVVDRSQLIFLDLKTQTLLDLMVKEMPGQGDDSRHEPTNFPCFKNTNLARIYGKRNARAGVMLSDTS